MITNKNNASSDNNIELVGCNIQTGNTTGRGISFVNVSDSTVRYNQITHNGVQNVGGIVIDYGSNNNIFSNNLSGWGISLQYASHKNNVYSNNIVNINAQDTDGHGIVVSGGAGAGFLNKIYSNNIVNVSGLGISIDGGSYRNDVYSNYIQNTSSDALNFESGYGESPKNNNMHHNIVVGGRIAVTGVSVVNTATGNKIESNTVDNAPSDAYLFLYVNESIINNNFAYNGSGTEKAYIISASSNNTISGNYAINFLNRGIIEYDDLGSSFNNIIIDNILINTTGIELNVGGTGSSLVKDNYGVAPFNFGNKVTAPTAFGAGDTYYDTDVNYYCFYNSTAWVDMSTGLVTCT